MGAVVLLVALVVCIFFSAVPYFCVVVVAFVPSPRPPPPPPRRQRRHQNKEDGRRKASLSFRPTTIVQPLPYPLPYSSSSSSSSQQHSFCGCRGSCFSCHPGPHFSVRRTRSAAATTTPRTRTELTPGPTISTATNSTSTILLVGAECYSDGLGGQLENDEYYEYCDDDGDDDDDSDDSSNSSSSFSSDNPIDYMVLQLRKLQQRQLLPVVEDFVNTNFDWSNVPPRPGGVRQYVRDLVVDAMADAAAAAAADMDGDMDGDGDGIVQGGGEDRNKKPDTIIDATLCNHVERAVFGELLRVNEIDSTTLSTEVKEVLFCYFVTGSVDDVRERINRLNSKGKVNDDDDDDDDNNNDSKKKKKKKNQLRLFVRENPTENRGPFCILQEYKDTKQRNGSNTGPQQRSIVEYYATPIYDERCIIPMSIVEMNRTEIPFNVANLVLATASQALVFAVGLVSSIVLNVRLFGPTPSLMSCWRPGALVSSTGAVVSSTFAALSRLLRSALRDISIIDGMLITIIAGPLLGIFAWALAEEILDGDDLDEWDVDWLHKLPRAALSNLSYILSLVGTRTDVSLLRPLLVSTFRGILPGVLEEFLFRGVLQTALTRSFGTFPAVVVQAVIFGMCHFGYRSKAYLVVTSIIGFVLGQAYALSGNLALPILIHAGLNFMSSLRSQLLLRSLTAYEINSLIALTPRALLPKKKPQE